MAKNKKLQTVGGLIDALKDKDPNMLVALWLGENKPMHFIESIDYCLADPNGDNNEDGIPTPEMVLLVKDFDEYVSKDEPYPTEQITNEQT